ncbi:MAG: hypothetical protein M1497_02505 [Nitrospirae bacterium]|nr:hypothetical protein [Nitrospirota bacterium]
MKIAFKSFTRLVDVKEVIQLPSRKGSICSTCTCTNMKEFYAHSIEGKTVEERHRFEEHLFGTANLAGQFAADFGSEEWGYPAGLWHDLGKMA